MELPAAIPAFFSVVTLASIGSTSDEVKRLSRFGAVEGTLVWAAEQTAGHGRFGRTWISPPGNLYFSLLLRPYLPPGQALQLTFVAAVALAEAIQGLLPPQRRVTCKWPNDVLVAGRKISGILLESSVDAAALVDSLVVGIGVNVASHPPPDVVDYAATSLHAEGAGEETAGSMLARFCAAFVDWHAQWRAEGFEPVRQAWLGRADKLHRPIEVRLEGEIAAGIFTDLDASGALVLQQGDKCRLIVAGDVLAARA